MQTNSLVGYPKGFKYINGNILTERSGVRFVRKRLRIGVQDRYKFPDIIELKITNKCSYSCSWCSSKDWELGENTVLPDLYAKLSELPEDLSVLFIISGGNILDCLSEFDKLCKFICRFPKSSIITKIGLDDFGRLNNLSRTFGSQLGDTLYDIPLVLEISLDRFRGYSDIESYILKLNPNLRLYYNFYLLKINHTVFPFTKIQEMFSSTGFLRGNRNFLLVEGGIGSLDQGDTIRDFLKSNRNYMNPPNIMFDKDSYEQLKLGEFLLPKEKELYSAGWDNYLYIDATKGLYKESKLSPAVSWEGLTILDYYDSLDK